MIELINGPIPPQLAGEAMQALESANVTGANTWFMGRVRADLIQAKTVSGISYSAYEPMVHKAGNKLIEEALQKFDAQDIRLWHSLGMVKVGEVSLLVQVSSGHRKAAFHALEWMVDELKLRLPIWKKEMFADGSHRWIGTPGSG